MTKVRVFIDVTRSGIVEVQPGTEAEMLKAACAYVDSHDSPISICDEIESVSEAWAVEVIDG